MPNYDKYQSILISGQLPQYIRTEYPNFVRFLEKYYEWLEREDGSLQFIRGLAEFGDIDETTSDLVENFSEQFMKSIPDNMQSSVNKRTLIKHAVQQYRSKGNENSIKFLFRILFGEEVTMYYPSRDMLRASDGKWTLPKSIKVDVSNVLVIENLAGGKIIGQTSGAEGIVDYILTYTSLGVGQVEVAELFLHEVSHLLPLADFEHDEVIEGTSIDGVYSYTLDPLSVPTDITITSGSNWYHPGDRCDMAGLTGEDGRCTIKTVSKGAISALTIYDGGFGYRPASVTNITTNDTGTGAIAKITGLDGESLADWEVTYPLLDGPGVITAMTMLASGGGYIHKPDVDISIGSGVVIRVDSIDIGTVTALEVINFGNDYLPPTGADFTFNRTVQLNPNKTLSSTYDDFITGEILTIAVPATAVNYAVVERNHNDIMSLKINGAEALLQVGSTLTGQVSGVTMVN